MGSEELKPCPFCGWHNVQAKHEDGIFWHKCADCGATGPTLSRYSGEEGEPYTEWNTRAQLAALEAECERLLGVVVGMIDLAHEYRHLLTQQRFPDNDEGDAFRRHRDAQVLRIERILSAAQAVKVKSHE